MYDREGGLENFPPKWHDEYFHGPFAERPLTLLAAPP